MALRDFRQNHRIKKKSYKRNYTYLQPMAKANKK